MCAMRHRPECDDGAAPRDRPGCRVSAVLALATAVPLLFVGIAASHGQDVPQEPPAAAGPPSSPPEERLERQRDTLDAVHRDLTISSERQDALRREIAALDRDRAKLTRDLVQTAARIDVLEERVEQATERLAELSGEQARIRASLTARRATLTQLLSSLQRLGTSPPPALVVSPDDAIGAVRGAMLISAVMPEIHREAEALASDVAELAAVREELTRQRTALARDLVARAEGQSRLGLLIDEKQAVWQRQTAALDQETERARELAANAESLEELIAALEAELVLSRKSAERARAALDETPPKSTDFARLAPSIAFSEARGLLPLPTRGVALTQFGEIDEATGDPAEGLTLATRSGARVISPADGWVAYAGPFRRYGEVLILNAGDDYHLLMAGMGRVDVGLGQFVLSGEPVGEMGERRLASATSLSLESAQPTLYIEFRQGGTPVDPSPWWLRSNDEKESG